MNNFHRLVTPLLVPTILSAAWSAQAADADAASAPAAATPPPAAAARGNAEPEGEASAAPRTPSSAATPAAPTEAAAPSSTPPNYAPPSPPVEPPRGDPGPTTLFGSHSKFGGYGGISALYSRFAGRDSGEFCLEGALLIDRTLSVGLAGCGLSRSIATTKFDPSANPDYRTRVGFGGAVVRYHFATYQYFNFAVGSLIGGGAITSDESRRDSFDNDRSDRHADPIFVLEPHLAAYLTMTRWLRVGATGGYRIVTGVDKKGLSNSDLSAPTFGLQVQAGWF